MVHVHALSLAAILVCITAGTALARLLITEHGLLGIVEMLSLGVLFGAGLVSISLFVLGLILSGAVLTIGVSVICMAVVLTSLAIRRPRLAGLAGSWAVAPAHLIFISLLAAQVGFMIWFVLSRGLGWDGIMVWEIKARIICLNQGSMPFSYFGDLTRRWSHPEYPLMVPLTEAWLYSWAGQCNQSMAKFVFPPFYVAAVGLLYIGASKQNVRGVLKFIAPLLIFVVPLVIIGVGGAASGGVVSEGSLSSGGADFPLAVIYLAAAIYLLDYIKTESKNALYISAAMGALLPWVKTEGMILWGFLLALTGIVALARRNARPLVAVGLPGAGVILGWTAITRLAGATSQDFLPVTLAVLVRNLDRTGLIFGSLGLELVRASHWGALWLGVAAITVLALVTRAQHLHYVHLALILLPIAVYPLTYYFSNWNPVSEHIDSSLYRLLLQPALLAVLYVSILPVRPLASQPDT